MLGEARQEFVRYQREHLARVCALDVGCARVPPTRPQARLGEPGARVDSLWGHAHDPGAVHPVDGALDAEHGIQPVEHATAEYEVHPRRLGAHREEGVIIGEHVELHAGSAHLLPSDCVPVGQEVKVVVLQQRPAELQMQRVAEGQGQLLELGLHVPQYQWPLVFQFHVQLLDHLHPQVRAHVASRQEGGQLRNALFVLKHLHPDLRDAPR
mmetsp:Transcript_112041/g.317607  ORF Transcript_112041/g.317607 Transcript_112041/m.317607 type:complete len:211 (-) Transcript_112041:1265-1897(-)